MFRTSRQSSAQPPKPRDFKPNLSRDSVNGGSKQANESATTASSHKQPEDLARAREASIRVVTTGKLDPRYRAAARRWTALICATPIALYLSYELYRRQFMGVEQKKLPSVPVKETDDKI
jgi:hypothetical protein